MIPLTGPFSSDMLRAELGLGNGAVEFTGETLDKLRRLTNTPAGPIPVHAARGTHMVLASAVQQVLKDAMGNPAAAGAYRAVIEPGVVIGSNAPGTPALDVGQLPAGSSLTLDVYGTVQGAGGIAGVTGAINGGNGGHAIKANYPNQAVTITRRASSIIRSGGGGGGKGGNGGQGGTGGYGYTGGTTTTEGDANTFTGKYGTYSWNRSEQVSNDDVRFGGVVVYNGPRTDSFVSGGWTYVRGNLRDQTTQSDETGTVVTVSHYGIYRQQAVGVTTYPGGAGGAGAAGGNGGKGQGHDGAQTSAASGGIGAAGAAGGTNAGNGGKGGNGGGGGASGTWGANGFAGNSGATGATGNNGNYTGGLAGSAGTAGGAGGAAGSAILKGTANVTIVDEGGTLTGPIT